MGANFLLANELADITYVINLLAGPGDSLEKPFLGDQAYDILSRNFSTFGYTSQVKLKEDLKDKPVQTLLNIVLYFNSRT